MPAVIMRRMSPARVWGRFGHQWGRTTIVQPFPFVLVTYQSNRTLQADPLAGQPDHRAGGKQAGETEIAEATGTARSLARNATRRA